MNSFDRIARLVAASRDAPEPDERAANVCPSSSPPPPSTAALIRDRRGRTSLLRVASGSSQLASDLHVGCACEIAPPPAAAAPAWMNALGAAPLSVALRYLTPAELTAVLLQSALLSAPVHAIDAVRTALNDTILRCGFVSVRRGDALCGGRVEHSSPLCDGLLTRDTVLEFIAAAPPPAIAAPLRLPTTPLRLALAPAVALRVSVSLLSAEDDLTGGRSDALLDVATMASLGVLNGDWIDVNARVALRVFVAAGDARGLWVAPDVCCTLFGDAFRSEPLVADVARRLCLDDAPPATARSVVIALLPQADVPLDADLTDAVRGHFERTPHCALQSGDIFAVDAMLPLLPAAGEQRLQGRRAPAAAPAIYEAPQLAERRVRVFFSVTATEPASAAPLLIDPQRTRVEQRRGEQRRALPPALPLDAAPPSLAAHIDVVRALVRDLVEARKGGLVAGVLFHGGAHVAQSARLIADYAARAPSCRVNVLVRSARDIGQAPATMRADAAQSPVLRQVGAFVDSAAAYAPCVVVLEGVERLVDAAATNVSASSVGAALQQCGARGVLLVACTEDCAAVAGGVRAAFAFERRVDAPSEQQRAQSLAQLLARRGWSGDIDAAYVAAQSAGAAEHDLRALLDDVRRVAAARDDVGGAVRLLGGDAVAPTTGDVETALERWRGRQSRAIGAPRVPQVRWDDVGGLEHAKRELLDVVRLPLERPELFASGVRQRSGVLMYGAPGTGKTFLAKAVATECGLAFLSVKGPELLNMYVGESERNVRAVFDKAREASPCVVFFDELDALAPNRGGGGGVMDRVVAQLLAELDGMQANQKLFVIGATNRPDLLDPALLRPGRFDRMVYLGVPATREEQTHILSAVTRKFTLGADCDFARLLATAPLTLTGADFYALCADAFLAAVEEMVVPPKRHTDDDDDDEEPADEEEDDDAPVAEIVDADARVVVSQRHFAAALASLTPSVSEAELRSYERLQAQFRH